MSGLLHLDHVEPARAESARAPARDRRLDHDSRDGATDRAHASVAGALADHAFGSFGTPHGLETRRSPRLIVTAPGDRYEQEADRAAATAVTARAEPEAPRLGRHAVAHDVTGVRIHTGPDAAEAARAVQAKAFTHDRDIYFGAGFYRPETAEGRALIAHELGHAVHHRPGVIARQALGAPAPPAEAQEGAASTDVDSLATELTRSFESDPGSQAQRLRSRLDALDPARRVAVLGRVRATLGPTQRARLDALLDEGAASGPDRAAPGPPARPASDATAPAEPAPGRASAEAERAREAAAEQPVPAPPSVPASSSGGAAPPTPTPPARPAAAASPSRAAATARQADAPAREGRQATAAARGAASVADAAQPAAGPQAAPEADAGSAEPASDDAAARLPSLAESLEPVPEVDAGPTSSEALSRDPLAFGTDGDTGDEPDATQLPEASEVPQEPAAPPVDIDSLVATVTDARAGVEGRVRAQAATSAGTVRERGQAVTATIEADVERTSASIRQQFAGARSTLSASLTAARAQVASQVTIRQAELVAHGTQGRQRVEAVFTDHRARIQRIVGDDIAAGERLRTTYATRAHEQTAQKATTARQRGAAQGATYPRTERGDVQRNAATAVAERTAREIENKEPETVNAIDDVVRSIPDKFQEKGAEILDGYDRPLPELLGRVDEQILAAGQHLAELAAAAREELTNIERDSLDQYQAMETAALQRIEAFLPQARRQVGAAVRSSAGSIEDGGERAVSMIGGVADEGAAILGQAESPHPTRAPAFSDAVVTYVNGAGDQSVAALQESGDTAAQHLQGGEAAAATVMRTVQAQVTARLGEVTGQQNARLAGLVEQVDREFGATLTTFDGSIAATEEAIRARFAPAVSRLESDLAGLLRQSEEKAADALAQGMAKNDEALSQLDGRMTDAADDAAWDHDHPILSRIRDVASFIGGLVVGILKVLAVIALVIVAIVAVVVALIYLGVPLLTALLVGEILMGAAAVIGVGLLAYGVYRGTRDRMAQGRGFWGSLAGGVGDVTGITAIYTSLTAEGLTPYERGKLLGEGGTTLVLTVIGARELAGRIGRAPRLSNPAGEVGAGRPVVAEPVAPRAAPRPAPVETRPTTAAPEAPASSPATAQPAAPRLEVVSEPNPQLSAPRGQLRAVGSDGPRTAAPTSPAAPRVTPAEPAVPRPAAAQPQPAVRGLPSEPNPQVSAPRPPELQVIRGEGRPAAPPEPIAQPQVQARPVVREATTGQPIEVQGGRPTVGESPGAPGGRAGSPIEASAGRSGRSGPTEGPAPARGATTTSEPPTQGGGSAGGRGGRSGGRSRPAMAEPPTATTPTANPPVQPPVRRIPYQEPTPQQRAALSLNEGATARPTTGSRPPTGFEDVLEQPGVSERPRLGTRPQSEPAQVGNFGHANYEQLARLTRGRAEELVPSGELPPGLRREVEVPHPDYPPGSRPRIDRLDPAAGEVIEIKPDTPYGRRQGPVEARQYADWMNRYGDPPANGGRWTPRVVYYDMAKLRAFLRSIGYLQ